MQFTFKNVSEVVFRDISALGSAVFYWFLALLLLSTGYVTIFIFLAFFFVVIYLLVATIRFFFFKERPHKELYSNIFEKIDASSFPSVHAARSVFLAFVLHMLFGSTLVFSVLVFGAAFLVCVSRVILHKHDIIDVLGGAVLGVLFFLLLF